MLYEREKLMDKKILAEELFTTGINCAQAVMLAFKDELNLSEDVIKKISVSHGGGLGRQRLTCGAVSSMCSVLGFLLTDGNDKLKAYKIVQDACERFKNECGSIICADFLGKEGQKPISPVPEDRTKEYYKKRPCGELCGIAAKIAQDILEENK